MGSVGLAEMLVIAVVALLVFGPERLPELARQAGRALARFRAEATGAMDELKRAAELDDLDRELRGLRTEVRSVRDGLARSVTAPRPADAPPPTDPDAT